MENAILHTLQNLIAPGKEMRLSSPIEQTFHQFVYDNIPDHKPYLCQLAERYVEHFAEYFTFAYSLSQVDRRLYAAGLIHLGTVLIPRIQLMLLDLLRLGHFPAALQVAAWGETAPLVFIAVQDFCEMVEDAYNVYGQASPFRLEVLQAIALPEAALPFAQEVYERFAVLKGLPALEIDWQSQHTGNLLLVDVSTREIAYPALEDLLPLHQGIVIVAEGDPDQASTLMQWRAEWLAHHPEMITLGPCGAEFGNRLPSSCHQCDVRRYEAMHYPGLYQQFDDTFKDLIEANRRKAPPDPLQWSYIILDTEQGDTDRQPSLPTASAPSLQLRYMGRYLQDKSMTEDSHSDEMEYIRLCPATVQELPQKLTIKRESGKSVPSLRFGELFTVSDLVPAVSQKQIVFNIQEQTLFHTQDNNAFSFIKDYGDATRQAVDRCGHRLFNFESMKPAQHEIISQALMGKPILGIAATGMGKSECFILPAMLLSGITLVISPLKSLMKDQVEQRLQDRYGLGNVTTFINGDVTFAERQYRLKKIEQGYFKLVYLTPEQLARSYILESLRRAHEAVGIRYLALDEAHCISQWGHDFRPSYLNIICRLAQYEIFPVCMALTATASPKVREDLCIELGLDNKPVEEGGNVYVYSSNRPELNLIVRVVDSNKTKSEAILQDLRAFQEEYPESDSGAAIVFMPHAGSSPDSLSRYYPLPLEERDTWKEKLDTGSYSPADLEILQRNANKSEQGALSANVTHFASYIERQLRQQIAIYHGKMEDDQESDETPDGNQAMHPYGMLNGRTRRQEQEAFIRGERNIMVATKGFGMGIDKSNVRLVIHRTPTANLEAYAQEAGRAGRDAEMAQTILYFSPDETEDSGSKVKSDYDIQRFFIESNYIRRIDIEAMYAYLHQCQPWCEGHLYLTGDEVIAFLDQYKTAEGEPFEWVSFEEWTPIGKQRFSGEHLQIMQAGHDYKNKITYIQRILGALFRLRPDIQGIGQHVALIEEFAETPLQIQLKRLDAPKIVGSTFYFGRVLRECGVTAAFFTELLEYDTLESLAMTLNHSLAETAQMLRDIQQAEGRFRETKYGRQWESSLLDIRLTTPHYIHGNKAAIFNEEAWLRYAGAYRRKSKPADAKKPVRALLDWFSAGMNSPTGWEIVMGSAFEPAVFPEYLDAFMKIHDERKQNDWDAYHRLITDYIGLVRSDSHETRADKSCLRATLLGYLKTYEVVIGNNCYSCNVCVPDENFDADMEKRNAVIVRMDESTQELLDDYETYSSQMPPYKKIERIFKRIDKEEKAGRSLRAYVTSWTSRLLQDTPGHHGALWMRLYGHLEGYMTLSESEPQRIIEQLESQSSKQVAFDSLIECIDRLAPLNATLLKIRGNLAWRAGYIEQARESWYQARGAADLTPELEREVIVALLEAVESEEAALLQAQLGWLEQVWQTSLAAFKPLLKHLSWEEMLAEIPRTQPRFWAQTETCFIWAWLEEHLAEEHMQQALIHLTHSQQWREIQDEAIAQLWTGIPLSWILIEDTHFNAMFDTLRQRNRWHNDLAALLNLWAVTQPISEVQTNWVIELLLNNRLTVIGDTLSRQLLDAFNPASEQSVEQLENWSQLLPAACLNDPEFTELWLVLALAALVDKQTDVTAYPSLFKTLIKFRAIHWSHGNKQLMEQWWAMSRLSVEAQIEYLQFLREADALDADAAYWHEIHPKAISQWIITLDERTLTPLFASRSVLRQRLTELAATDNRLQIPLLRGLLGSRELLPPEATFMVSYMRSHLPPKTPLAFVHHLDALLMVFEPHATTEVLHFIRWFPSPLPGKAAYQLAEQALHLLADQAEQFDADERLYQAMQALMSEVADKQIQARWQQLCLSSTRGQQDYLVMALMQPQVVIPWEQISLPALKNALRMTEVSRLAEDKKLLKVVLEFTTPDKVLTSEIMLLNHHALKMDEQHWQRIAEILFNGKRALALDLVSQGNVSLLAARHLLPYLLPKEIPGLVRWFQCYPAQLLLQAPEIAIQTFEIACQVIRSTRYDIADDSQLYQQLIRLYDHLPQEATILWDEVTALSPREKQRQKQQGILRHRTAIDEVYAELQAYRSRNEIGQFLDGLKAYKVLSEEISELIRYRHAAEILLSRYPNLRSRPTADEILGVCEQLNPYGKPTNAAMTAVFLDHWRRLYNRGWLTPIAYIIEAYVLCGAYEIAEKLAAEYPDVTVSRRRVSPQLFINTQRQKQQTPVSSSLLNALQHVTKYL